MKDSEILAAEFEKIGVEYHLMVIEEGDHGFRNPEHRAQAGAALIAWFDKHLN